MALSSTFSLPVLFMDDSSYPALVFPPLIFLISSAFTSRGLRHLHTAVFMSLAMQTLAHRCAIIQAV